MAARPALLLFLVFCPIQLAFSQTALVDNDCNPTEFCVPNRDCTPRVLARSVVDCRTCLLHGLLGTGCQVFGNDPACEARKSAQNAASEVDAARFKAECETQKSQEKLLCEMRVAGAKSQCEVGKGIASAPERFLAATANSESRAIPEAVTKQLIDAKLYQPDFLSSLRVIQLGKGQRVPPPFLADDVGFTVGTRIFLLNDQSIEGVPLKFWLKQIELARLFSEYGVTDLAKALAADSKGILGLVDAKVLQNCTVLSC